MGFVSFTSPAACARMNVRAGVFVCASTETNGYFSDSCVWFVLFPRDETFLNVSVGSTCSAKKKVILFNV